MTYLALLLLVVIAFACGFVVALLLRVLVAPAARRWRFVVRHLGLTVSLEVLRMLLKPGFKVSAEVVPLTADGQEAAIDGEVAWSVSTEGVVSFEFDPTNSKRATFSALEGEGLRTTGVAAVFDADLGEGVRTITAVGEITVAPAEAVTAELRFAAPEPQ